MCPLEGCGVERVVAGGGAPSLSSPSTAVHQLTLSRVSARHTIRVALHDFERSCGYFIIFFLSGGFHLITLGRSEKISG